MFRKFSIIMAIITALVAISACGRMTRVDTHWGKSYEAARQGQILNPKADRSQAQAPGLDGTAALNTLETYQQRFKGTSSRKTVGVIK